MRATARLLGAALAIALLPLGAQAVSFSFDGTSAKGVAVSFEADISIVGDALTIVLTNNSTQSLNPDDVLTSLYFDVFDGVSRPTLTYTGATGDVCLTARNAADDCSVTNNEADLRAFNPGQKTWQFKDDLSLQFGAETLTFGIGTAGNNSLTPNGFNGNIVGGIDYGIYAGDVSTNNLRNRFLATGSITFTFSGASGFTDADIGEEVVFGLGTQPDSTGFVPEPYVGVLLGLGLLGLAWSGRRR